tara:strand:- start:830 stop:1960 length:1131 start_codon:yes stop_codon:yes gene_type:complete
MNKLKIMTIVGTRPEIIRLSRIIPKLDKFTNHCLVHTGQNYDYELNEIFFKDLELRKPNYFLNAACENSIQTIGKILIEIDIILEKIKPDAVLVLGDTNSCLSLIAAKKKKIPTFHFEAGNRCFDMRVPEEINRKIVDHTADINMTYSSIARRYLIDEGIPKDLVIKIGSPMKEVLNYNKYKINNSNILADLNLNEGDYFLVSIHREENIESKNFSKFVSIINDIEKKFNIPIIVSTHPRTRKKIEETNSRFNKNVRLLKPLSFTSYIKLQAHSKVVLSDSGTINEESSILKFPALNLREAHERPEAMEEASVMMVGMNKDRIFQALEILISKNSKNEANLYLPSDYNIDNVSEKVLRIIISYTDYVKNVIWKQYK